MKIDLEILDVCDVTYMVEYKSVSDGHWHLEYEADDRADALEYMLHAVINCDVPHRITFMAHGALCDMTQPKEGEQ
jgi:hypothetical protein